MHPSPRVETVRPSRPSVRVPTADPGFIPASSPAGPAARQRGGRLPSIPETSAQLLLDGGEVEPGALPGDQAILEIEDVQEARTHRSPTAVQPERMPGGRGVQHRFVDDVVRSVPTTHRLEAVDTQLPEQGAVELADLLTPVQWPTGPADDVVFGAGSEAGDDRRQVTVLLSPVMTIHE